jgi:hypothetical protein
MRKVKMYGKYYGKKKPRENAGQKTHLTSDGCYPNNSCFKVFNFC